MINAAKKYKIPPYKAYPKSMYLHDLRIVLIKPAKLLIPPFLVVCSIVKSKKKKSEKSEKSEKNCVNTVTMGPIIICNQHL